MLLSYKKKEAPEKVLLFWDAFVLYQSELCLLGPHFHYNKTSKHNANIAKSNGRWMVGFGSREVNGQSLQPGLEVALRKQRIGFHIVVLEFNHSKSRTH